MHVPDVGRVIGSGVGTGTFAVDIEVAGVGVMAVDMVGETRSWQGAEGTLHDLLAHYGPGLKTSNLRVTKAPRGRVI